MIITILLNALFALSFLGILYCAMALVRHHAVHDFRMELIDRISQATKIDLAAGRSDFEWRYDYYRMADYHTMVWQFWRPLRIHEWYPNNNFITPGAPSPLGVASRIADYT